MGERGGRRGRRVLTTALLVTVLVVVSSCSASSSRNQLAQALRDTQSAVSAAELAISLVQEGRTTRAAARVAVGDMADQIGSAQQQLLGSSAATAELRDQRQQTQTVIAEALVAVQDAEDAVAAAADTAPVLDDLSRVQHDLTSVVGVVGEPQ